MTLRRSARRKAAGGSKTGGGWRGGWRDRFDIPREVSYAICLAPGKYLDHEPEAVEENGGEPPESEYFSHVVHPVKRNKNEFRNFDCRNQFHGTAFKGPGTKDECVGCYYGVQPSKDDRDKRVGVSAKYSINIIEFGVFHKVERKDKQGKVVRFDKDGKNHKRGDAITDWTRCERPKAKNRILENIDEELADGTARLFLKKYIDVGKQHFEQVSDITTHAEKFCACGGDLTPKAFDCEECEEQLIDIEEGEDGDGMTPKEIRKYANEKQKCKQCGHFGYAKSDPVCSDCDEPMPLGPFDVVAFLRKTGEGTGTTVSIDAVVPFALFEFEDGSPIVEMEEDDGEWYPAYDEETGKPLLREDLKKVYDAQFDFEKVHRLTDNKFFADYLKVDNPYDDGEEEESGKSRHRKYSSKVDDDDDDDTDEKPKKRSRSRGNRHKRVRQ